MNKYVSAEDAVSVIHSNDNVYIHGIAATPTSLVAAMVARHSELKNVKLYHLHVEGEAPYNEPAYEDSFHVINLFTGPNSRKAVNEGRADYVPIFLSEVPALFRNKVIPLDVAVIQVSPPDKNGFCTLGTSVDCSLAAVQSAKIVIAEVNPQMPRTMGDSAVHVSKIQYMVEVDRPIFAINPRPLSDTELKIGRYIADLIEDGSTLQMGIGAIPDAALAALENHKELGIHTEMFSDGVLGLVESGVITNEHKVKHRNYIVTGFALGSQKLYDFVNDNPQVRFLDVEYVNDTKNIRQNPKVIAINSAIEVDITGQVVSDSIGTRVYSGVGGQMDFMRGASLSKGGKPIIALPSVTSKGRSRIAGILQPGGGVVTTRAHMHYVVTEFGVAYLYGKSLRERAIALIDIAHPDHREELSKIARDEWKFKI